MSLCKIVGKNQCKVGYEMLEVLEPGGGEGLPRDLFIQYDVNLAGQHDVSNKKSRVHGEVGRAGHHGDLVGPVVGP